MRRLAVVIVTLALSGCGSGRAPKPSLDVSAAASLKTALTRYGAQFQGAAVRFSFAGSDLLAAQIEQGLRPDVFAAANLKLPQLLYSKGLVERPQSFAANRLVLAAPASSRKVHSLADIERSGVSLAIGSASVPVGAYTRIVLSHLPSSLRARIQANVRSEEPDVSGIVGKLTEGAVDAGFTYLTDVRATGGQLKAIDLPRSLRPVVTYGVVVVKGSAHRDLARRFIAGLIAGSGRRALLASGFLAPAGG